MVNKDTPQKSLVSKRTIVEKFNKRIEQKTAEKKFQKRIIGFSSDSNTYVEDDVSDIVTTSRRKIDGKKVHLNISGIRAPLDNVSIYYVANVQKWKFVCQRRINFERELNVEALKCKEVIYFLKETRLMKTVSELRSCYTKLVTKFIVNLSTDV